MDLSRYSRQMADAHLGRAGQQRLAASRVAIVGCGALGTVSASWLVRAGVGYVRLIDRDFVELHNLQRQVLFDEDDVAAGLPKAVAAAGKLARVNSATEVEGVVADLVSNNAVRLLGDVDLIVDGVDNFEGRFLINDFCVSRGLPWIHGAVIGATGLVMDIVPGETACLRCLYAAPPPPGSFETCDTAGVLGPTVGVVAALQAAEALKLLTGARGDLCEGLRQYEIWDGELQHLQVTRRDDCPACAAGEFPYLQATAASRVTSLCGREAVQLTLSGEHRLDLGALAERLLQAGEVTQNAFMLRLRAEGYELNVFADARAIIKGTTDETLARSLYARYIGL